MLTKNESSFALEAVQDQKTLNLASLSTLVKENKLDEIKKIIHQQELMSNGQWKYSKENHVKTAVREAILLGQNDTIQFFFDAGISPDDYICFAVKSGNLAMVELLVENGAKIYPEWRDRDSWNDNYGLKTAVINGFAEIADYLLQRGAKANVYCNGGTLGGDLTLLAKAAQDGNISIVESLLNHGASIASAIIRAYKVLYQNQYKSSVSQLERDQIKNSYERVIKTLMDYAFGMDFSKEYRDGVPSYSYGFLFLKDMDVSDVNFIGVSLDGQPITREILIREKLVGAEQALLSVHDLSRLPTERQKALTGRLENAFQRNGKLINPEGIVNLVPLCAAAEKGDIEAVKSRLTAGIDPNKQEQSPLVLAAKNGHFDTVKLLVDAQLYFRKNRRYPIVTNDKNLCLTVEKAEVNKILISFENNNFLSIATENNYTLLTQILKHLGYPIIQKIEKIITAAQSRNEHAILAVKRSGRKLACYFYSNAAKDAIKQEVRKFIEKSQKLDYMPVIFTDKNNMDVIEELIESQYQALDKGKQSIVEAILVARSSKHIEIAEYLESLQDINERNSEGETLLHKAVQAANTERVKALISKGADVNLKNNQGQSAIDIAVGNSSPEWKCSATYFGIIELLLAKQAQVELSTLSIALEANNISVFSLLLPIAPKVSVPVFRYTTFGKKPLRYDPWYLSLMFKALENEENIKFLMLLKEYGADFNQKNEHGRTLMDGAIDLLTSSRKIIKTMQDKNPHLVGCEGHTQGIRENTHSSRLQASRKRKRFDEDLLLINYLLENGVKFTRNEEGVTHLYRLIKGKNLYYLANNGYEEWLDKLLENGADVNATNKDYSTPLHAAVLSGDATGVSYLIKHNALLDAKNESGWTPLHCAANQGLPTISKILIEAGAATTILNNDGLTPLQLLKKSYKTQKEELLSIYKKEKENSLVFFERNKKCEDEKPWHKFLQNKIALDRAYQETKKIINGDGPGRTPLVFKQ